MSRRYKPAECSRTDIITLQQIASDDANPRIAVRAQIVLKCAEGPQVKDIAEELNECPIRLCFRRTVFQRAV